MINISIMTCKPTSHRVETMAVNGPANVLVCGHSDGRISLRAVWNLQQTHIVSHSAHGAIKCLWFTEGTCVRTCFVCNAHKKNNFSPLLLLNIISLFLINLIYTLGLQHIMNPTCIRIQYIPCNTIQ